MKKIFFIVIMFFCLFLIACKENKNDRESSNNYNESKIDLESNQYLDLYNLELESNIDGNTQVIEENETDVIVSTSELNQSESNYENNESIIANENRELSDDESDLTEELQATRVSLTDELKQQIGELYCRVYNAKYLLEKYKDNPVLKDDLIIGEYLGSYGKDNDYHVIFIFNNKYHNQILGISSFTDVSILDSNEGIVITYTFNNLSPDFIVLTNDGIYSFQEACDEGLLNVDDMNMIYEQYQLMVIEAKKGRNNLTECDLTEETDSNEVEIDKELEFQLKSLLCEKSNEKRSDGMKKLTIEELIIIKYFGGFGENNNVHVLLMKDIIIDNMAIASYMSFYNITLKEGDNTRFYYFKKLPELIFVIDLNDKRIYTLQDACDNRLLTIIDMDIINEQFIEMMEK